MDLLQSILRTCHAEKYTESFKNNGVDAFILKILNDEDLKIIGVEEADLRELIIQHVSNLQIPSEKKIETVVDRHYALVVLNAMSMHLNKHFANLTYALKREDVDLCDITVTPAVNCLQGCFTSLDQRLLDFKKNIVEKENKKMNLKFHVLFPTLAATALILFCCAKYFRLKT